MHLLSLAKVFTIFVIVSASELSDEITRNEFLCKSDLCFYFNKEKVKWSEAEDNCMKNYAGHILDGSVQQDIWSEFSAWKGNITQIWMGVKIKNDRYFQSVGRKPVPVKKTPFSWKWMDNEQSNLIKDGSCVIAYFNGSATMLLKAHSCNMKEQYVCVVDRRNMNIDNAHSISKRNVNASTLQLWKSNNYSVEDIITEDVLTNNSTPYKIFSPTNPQHHGNTTSEQIDLFYVVESHQEMLDIIFIVGCVLSVLGQVLVFITFILLKHLKKLTQNVKIIANLSFALFTSYILFLVGFNQTMNKPICIVIAIAIHYFLMVTLLWITIEEYNQYLRMVKVFGIYLPKFGTKSSLIAWVLPFVTIIAILSYDYSMYVCSENYCWLSNNCFYYTFFPLLVIITIVNIILYILILCTICGKQFCTSQSQKDIVTAQIRVAVYIFLLLGMTCVFGALPISDIQIGFCYLYCTYSTIQGPFFFIFHIINVNEFKEFIVKCLFFMCKKDIKKQQSIQVEKVTRPVPV